MPWNSTPTCMSRAFEAQRKQSYLVITSPHSPSTRKGSTPYSSAPSHQPTHVSSTPLYLSKQQAQLTHSAINPAHSSTFLHQTQNSPPSPAPLVFPLSSTTHSALPSFHINSTTSLASSRPSRFPIFLLWNRSLSRESVSESLKNRWCRQ